VEVWAEGVASSVRVHARGQVCTVKYVHCQVCMRAGVQLTSMFTVKCVKLIHATVKYVHCQVCNCVKCVQLCEMYATVKYAHCQVCQLCEIHSCVQVCTVKYCMFTVKCVYKVIMSSAKTQGRTPGRIKSNNVKCADAVRNSLVRAGVHCQVCSLSSMFTGKCVCALSHVSAR
jgi:hypothetical protein